MCCKKLLSEKNFCWLTCNSHAVRALCLCVCLMFWLRMWTFCWCGDGRFLPIDNLGKSATVWSCASRAPQMLGWHFAHPYTCVNHTDSLRQPVETSQCSERMISALFSSVYRKWEQWWHVWLLSRSRYHQQTALYLWDEIFRDENMLVLRQRGLQGSVEVAGDVWFETVRLLYILFSSYSLSVGLVWIKMGLNQTSVAINNVSLSGIISEMSEKQRSNFQFQCHQ